MYTSSMMQVTAMKPQKSRAEPPLVRAKTKRLRDAVSRDPDVQ